MNKMIGGILIIFILILAQPTSNTAQTANFELTLIIPADITYFDSIAQAIKQDLTPLLVEVLVEGSPRPVYQNDLRNLDYDMAIFSLDSVNKPIPPLWSEFSPLSSIGQEIFQTSDPSFLSQASISNPDELLDLVDLYHNTSSQSVQIEIAQAIQSIYNQDWVLDMPLVSTVDITASWKDFTGYDAEEGFLNSLLLGASWENNPVERQNQERTTKELHVALQDFDSVRIPVYYTSSGSFEALGLHFSSAFLLDKFNNIQPNLVTSFSHITLNNGGSLWTLNLRQDASWSDGQPITAKDLKFTYDLVGFDWVAATNAADWNNLKNISIVNDHQLTVEFYDNAFRNKFTLATQYILPEHILNQTITIGEESFHPYENYNPSDSNLWMIYDLDPISAGPFIFNNELSERGIVDVFEKNPNYWSPSINDISDGVFNLTSQTPHPSYYFDTYSEVSIDNIVIHATSTQSIDPNTLVTTFLSGSRDILELDTIATENRLSNNNDVILHSKPIDGGGLTVLFNPNNEHLRNLDIRKAITQAVERSTLVNLLGLGHELQLTPVSTRYEEYYDPSSGLEFDFDKARDTFRENGYDALEQNDDISFEWPWEKLPFPIIPTLASLGLFVLIGRRRR